MPIDDLTAAQREAYTQVLSTIVTLHTLEIRHPDFSSPVRVVRDQRDLVAKLEVGAPEDPDTLVTFTALWFNFVAPEIGDDPNPTFDVTLDNVTHILTPYLELASASVVPISVSYRMYSWSLETDTFNVDNYPSAEPLHMEVFGASTTGHTAKFTITMVPVANRPFPFEKYTPERFPGLAT